MNKFTPWKRLPIWLAVSAVVIIAGIILMALLGFNTAAEKPDNTKFEDEYNIIVINDEKMQDSIKTYCEDVFESNDLCAADVQTTQGTGETQDRNAFIYTFTGEVSAEKQAKVKSEVESKIAANEALSADLVDIYTSWHTETVTSTADHVWRGAIAVGVVVALVYLGIRFGLGCALTGLAISLHDALFTLAVLAIARIPVYAAAPVWYAAIAALLSLAFWLIHCIKLRTLKKESQVPLDADTAVEGGYTGAWKWVAVSAGLVAVVVLLTGLIATAGVRTMALPLLIAVVAAAYSNLLLGPAIHLHVRRALDKFSRGNKLKYVGKEKKADK